jgi:ribose 1,5-bisphosphokinase
MRAERGTLALIVGPSGAGKDTLIAGAKAGLAHDPRFVFPRRLVTRMAIAHLEDHETITRAHFEDLRETGRYTLCWQAHGHGYILPESIKSDLAAGRVVVCNGSRAVVAEARDRYPASAIILVTAKRDLRASRLAARGRETPAEIAARLDREAPPVPAGTDPLVIDNSGQLHDGIARLRDALERLADAGAGLL